MQKKIGIILAFIVVITTTVNAQSECDTNYAKYRMQYKQKNYEDALVYWRKSFNNCPSYNKNIFTNGIILYKDRIKNDKQNQLTYLDTLMMIYDTRIEYFGSREYVLGKKGVDLLTYDKTKLSESYEMLKVSVDALANSTTPNVINAYFVSLVKLEQSTEGVTKQDVLDAYIVISDIISYNIINNEKYADYYKQVRTNAENIFQSYASCDDLINIFKERLKEGTEDTILLKKIIFWLDKNDCTDNDVFYTAVVQLHKLDPTAKSAYDMGNMSMAKKNYSEAVSYYKQAIQLQDDVDYKASYYLKLSYAYQMRRSYAEARAAANSAANLKPRWGEPYLILGNIYVASASSCGNSNLERGAVYWIAVDMFMKAKRIDNLLTEKANKRISTYSKYFPSKEDCFYQDIEEGSSYSIGCWIGKSTTVRTRD